MNTDNGLPPLDPNQNPGNSPNLPPAPSYTPPSSYDIPAGNVKSVSGLQVAIVLMLGVMTLLVPLGLYKIGSPTPCTPGMEKKGECVVVAAPSDCTPSVFFMESEFLTCKMIGAIGSEDFKNKNPGKYDDCAKLADKVKNQKGLKCYATAEILKAKIKSAKKPDPMEMPPMDVQKMSALNSLSPSTLTSDLVFTILIVILLLVIMTGASFFAHKKNREGYIHITGVFLIGIFVAYIYRYYVAGFYSGDIVVLMLSLIGAVPMVIIAVSKEGKLGSAKSIPDATPGDYVVDSSVKEAPVPSEALDSTEATKFEKMGMKHTGIGETLFILGFIALVLSLLPIGLVSMGKTSNADANMKKEANKLTSLVKKKAAPSADVNVDVGGSGEEGEEGEGDK